MISTKEMQITFAAAGYSPGGIDGVWGPKTAFAITQIMLDADLSEKPMSQKRSRIACVQYCLNEMGHEAGSIDGYVGKNTRDAVDSLLYLLVNGKKEVVERESREMVCLTSIPHQNDLFAAYGNPETEVPSRLVTKELPFKVRIDYNLRQTTDKITLHRDVIDQFIDSQIAVRNFYGDKDWRDLGLDRYAGGYNKRKMRGGDQWSTHAFGCAVDIYYEPNGLRTKCPQALFCGSIYSYFLEIMEEHEFLPAIKLWGADACHFQVARL